MFPLVLSLIVFVRTPFSLPELQKPTLPDPNKVNSAVLADHSNMDHMKVRSVYRVGHGGGYADTFDLATAALHYFPRGWQLRSAHH